MNNNKSFEEKVVKAREEFNTLIKSRVAENRVAGRKLTFDEIMSFLMLASEREGVEGKDLYAHIYDLIGQKPIGNWKVQHSDNGQSMVTLRADSPIHIEFQVSENNNSRNLKFAFAPVNPIQYLAKDSPLEITFGRYNHSWVERFVLNPPQDNAIWEIQEGDQSIFEKKVMNSDWMILTWWHDENLGRISGAANFNLYGIKEVIRTK